MKTTSDLHVLGWGAIWSQGIICIGLLYGIGSYRYGGGGMAHCPALVTRPTAAYGRVTSQRNMPSGLPYLARANCMLDGPLCLSLPQASHLGLSIFPLRPSSCIVSVMRLSQQPSAVFMIPPGAAPRTLPRLPAAVVAQPVVAFSTDPSVSICQPHNHRSTIGRHREGRRTRIICTRTLATGSFSASEMYDSSGGCPAMLE